MAFAFPIAFVFNGFRFPLLHIEGTVPLARRSATASVAAVAAAVVPLCPLPLFTNNVHPQGWFLNF